MEKNSQKTQSTRDKSQKQNINHSKRTFFVNLIIHILYLLVKMALLIIFIFTVLEIKLHSFQKTNVYQRVQQNLWLWQKQIIVDFRIVDNTICPQDFQDFVNFQWPGNIKGCYCQNRIGLYKYTAVLEGQCGHNQFQNGCLSIPQNQKQKFAYWKSGAHICIKRLKNYNFYSSLNSFINSNYLPKPCSESQEYQIDLIDSLKCPMTDIVSGQLLPQKIQEINFSFARESHFPIVHFRIVQDNFCQQIFEDHVSPGRHSNYILQKTNKFQCGKNDKRTIFIQQQSEVQLFQLNPKIKNKIENLPGYPALDEHFKYKLGFMRYPQWKYQCRNTPTLSLLQAKNHLSFIKISSTIKSCSYVIILCTIIALIAILLYFIDIFTHLRQKYVNGYLYLKDYQIIKIDNRSNLTRNRQSQIIKFVLTQLFVLVSFITLVIYYLQIQKQRSWFQSAFSCTQKQFVSYLKQYQNFYNSLIIYLMTSLFIKASILILDIFHIIYRFTSGDMQKQVKQQIIFQTKSQASQSTQNNHIKIMNTNLTQQNLIQNSFFLNNPAKQTLQIIDLIEFKNQQSSEYSKSQQQKK